MRYPIVIHKDEDSCYGVTVPDLPGCFSAGDTLEGAIDRAHEAIVFHIEGLLMQGAVIPERTPLEVHQADEHLADGIFAIVAVDLSKMDSKARRINITVPSRVLAIIDEAASREGESRSGTDRPRHAQLLGATGEGALEARSSSVALGVRARPLLRSLAKAGASLIIAHAILRASGLRLR